MQGGQRIGQGRRSGQGRRRGTGSGRGLGGGYGYGPGGECVCPNCGYRTPHQLTVPCYNQQCPKCGEMMTHLE